MKHEDEVISESVVEDMQMEDDDKLLPNLADIN